MTAPNNFMVLHAICQVHCKNGECKSKTGHCSNGCEQGYTGPQCSIVTYTSRTMRSENEDALSLSTKTHIGKVNYTDHKFNNCLYNCHTRSAEDLEVCNSSTSFCNFGCKNGYFGRTCNESCGDECYSCSQESGTCDNKTGEYFYNFCVTFLQLNNSV